MRRTSWIALGVVLLAFMVAFVTTTFPSGLGYGVIEDEGAPLTQRSVLNFTGTGVTCTDDAGSPETDCDIPGATAGYDVIEDEGAPLTQRSVLNFTGAGVTCTDDAGSPETDCDIPGGGGGGNSFETWDPPDGEDIVAESATDTAVITTGAGLSITGTASTDTANFTFEPTELGSLTWGSGSGFAWTFDASAGTDAVLTFADNAINVSTGELGVGIDNPEALFHVFRDDAGTVTPLSGSVMVIEGGTGAPVYLQMLAPSGDFGGLLVGNATNLPGDGRIVYVGVLDEWRFYMANGDKFRINKESGNDVALEVTQSGAELFIEADVINLTPVVSTDARTDILQIQSVSQNNSPGTTLDGQIRIWDDANAPEPHGRILIDQTGVTYQFNADAGISFENRPLVYANDLARFGISHAAWQQDTLTALNDEYELFRSDHPGQLLRQLAPSWSDTYIESLIAGYEVARAAFQERALIEVPSVPTLDRLNRQNPFPSPDTYRIADPETNETVSFRSNTPIQQGDSMVLVADRVTIDAGTGATEAIHTVPSTLKEEMLWLLTNDPTFNAQVRELLRGQ